MPLTEETAENDKPRDYRPAPEKNKEALRLKGKRLTKPVHPLKSRIPIRTFYSGEDMLAHMAPGTTGVNYKKIGQ
jgi:hypothetical protein